MFDKLLNTPLRHLESDFLISLYVEVSKSLFTHEIPSLDETRAKMKLSLFLWSASYYLHVFTGMKFHLGKKKKRRCVNTSSRDDILQWACFLKNFWCMYSICFPTLTCLNQGRLNIMKVTKNILWGLATKSEVQKGKRLTQQIKNRKYKNINNIFFVKFAKDWNFLLFLSLL